MDNANLVADKLHGVGFATKVLTSNAVQVSLSSRKVYAQEVETELHRIFSGIVFNVRSTNDNKIVVSWEA